MFKLLNRPVKMSTKFEVDYIDGNGDRQIWWPADEDGRMAEQQLRMAKEAGKQKVRIVVL